jgi:hypothetical protein
MNELEAVAEFREASAALRRAFGVRDDARVAQILADTRMGEATLNLTGARDRLAAADMALQAARAEPPAPADIDASRQPVTQPVPFLDPSVAEDVAKFHAALDAE